MTDDLEPQAYIAAIAARLKAEAGPWRPHFSPEEIEEGISRIPPYARRLFLEHRDGMSYRQIARKHWLTVRCVERQLAKALTHLVRAMREIERRR